jgi:hypothetical protein
MLSCYDVWSYKSWLVINYINNISRYNIFPIELIYILINFYIKCELINIPHYKLIECYKKECIKNWWKYINYNYRYEIFNDLKYGQDHYYERSFIFHCEYGCHNNFYHNDGKYSNEKNAKYTTIDRKCIIIPIFDKIFPTGIYHKCDQCKIESMLCK